MKALDTYPAESLCEALLEAIEDLGFPPEEAIPGMILAVLRLAAMTEDEEGALDEAANILADGGVD